MGITIVIIVISDVASRGEEGRWVNVHSPTVFQRQQGRPLEGSSPGMVSYRKVRPCHKGRDVAYGRKPLDIPRFQDMIRPGCPR
jgi:hypothetical protein